ncbi:MAG: response regulator [Proteobacteria bacterium]|nr:response regulator [Cystobacterineae bacterium]MCL2313935.1 response regulator [Pseudomonadota bacterium]
MENLSLHFKITGAPPTLAITNMAQVLEEFDNLGKVTIVLAGKGTEPYEVFRLCRLEGRKGRRLLVFACEGELQNPTQLLRAGVQEVWRWTQDKDSARLCLQRYQQQKSPASPLPPADFEEAWAILEPHYDAQGQLIDYVVLDATSSFSQLFGLPPSAYFFECFEKLKEEIFEPMQKLLHQGTSLKTLLPLPQQEGVCPISMVRLNSKILINAQTDSVEPPKNFAKTRFETLAAHTPIGIFEIGLNGQMHFANAMLMNMIHVTSLKSASLWPQRIFPADRIRVFRQIRYAQRSLRCFTLACRFQVLDNTVHWFQIKCAPLFDPKGEITSFVGTVRNANDSAQKTYQMDEVLNALPVGVIIQNPETNELLFCNHAFQNLVGFCEKTIQPDASPQDFYSYLQKRTDIFEQIKQSRHNENSQHQIKLSENEVRNVLSSRKKIHYSGQEAILCTCVDITEAEANKKQLYSIIQAMPDMLVRLSENGTVLECLNPIDEKRLHNVQVGTCVGKILPPKESAKFLTALLHWNENKNLELFEYHVEEENDTHTDLEVRVTSLGKGQFLALIRDITQNKRFQCELINAREAALFASRAKSQFLANMSHEIRTPINGVLGMIDLALSTPLSKEQSDYLYTAKTSGQNLLSILADILDLSKIEANKLEIESIPMSLEHILSETCNSLSHRVREKELELIVEILPGTPDKVVGDPTRLRQILTNLIANSIKFTHKGEVFVQVGVSQQSNPPMLSFSVADTGVGIPQNKLTTIFEAFTQADGSITRRFGGTGLGLTITKQLVEKLGGHISVNSEVDVGTCFRFNLPLDISQQPENVSKLFANKTGLILEANSTARWVLKRMLEQWGIAVQTVNTSMDAISLLQKPPEQHNLDFVVVDNINPHQAFLQWLGKNKPDFSLILLLRQPQMKKITNPLQQKFSILRPVFRHSMETTLHCLFNVPEDSEFSSKNQKAPSCEYLASLHILVAEDNVVNAKLARALLEKQGHKVMVVVNGREAIQAVEQNVFDVVIMDVQMPEMDGIAATEEIRSREKKNGGYLPIIALTANAMKGDSETCLKAGMDEYLTKPLQKKSLLEALSNALLLRKLPPS